MRRGKFNFQNTIINDGMYYDAPLIQSTETLALYAFKVTESNARFSRSACAGHLCAIMRACEHAHKWTARALHVGLQLLVRIFHV